MTDRTASLLLFFGAAFWGLYWLPVREIEAAGLSASFSVGLFNACPLVVLIPIILFDFRRQRQSFAPALLIGTLMGIGLGLYATGLVVSSVIRVTMLFYLTPIWSTIIGVIWLSEHLSIGRIIAVLLGLVGLWLLLAGGGLNGQPLNYGDYFALIAGVLWGFGAAGMKRWPDAPTAMTSTVQFVAVTVFCLVSGLLVFHDPWPTAEALQQALPVASLASILVLLPSIFVIFMAAKQLFPGRVGILMMSEVLVAILSATILLPEETLSLWQWTGGVIVIAACLIEIFSRDEPEADTLGNQAH